MENNEMNVSRFCLMLFITSLTIVFHVYGAPAPLSKTVKPTKGMEGLWCSRDKYIKVKLDKDGTYVESWYEQEWVGWWRKEDGVIKVTCRLTSHLESIGIMFKLVRNNTDNTKLDMEGYSVTLERVP